MKAFIVTVTAPDSWTVGNVLCSVNVGLREFSKSSKLEYDPLECGARVHEGFKLEKPK